MAGIKYQENPYNGKNVVILEDGEVMGSQSLAVVSNMLPGWTGLI